MKLSIVVPCFNEEPCIEAFVRAVDETKLSDLEFVFVNDGSTDGSLRILRELAKKPFQGTLERKRRFWQGCARRRGI